VSYSSCDDGGASSACCQCHNPAVYMDIAGLVHGTIESLSVDSLQRSSDVHSSLVDIRQSSTDHWSSTIIIIVCCLLYGRRQQLMDDRVSAFIRFHSPFFPLPSPPVSCLSLVPSLSLSSLFSSSLRKRSLKPAIEGLRECCKLPQRGPGETCHKRI